MAEEKRTRRKRGSLSRAEIVDAALRLMDGEGESALTFSRLGAELKSSPTAVYRHFASREDLLLALADRLDGISLEGYEPTDDWRADLTDLAWRAWRTAEEHPAAAAVTLLMVANSINELRAVEWILRAMAVAGLRGRPAVMQYQVYTQMVLGTASAYGARLVHTGSREVADGWIQVYAPTDPSQYPHAEAAKAELAMMNYREVFAKQLDMYLAALELVVLDEGEPADKARTHAARA